MKTIKYHCPPGYHISKYLTDLVEKSQAEEVCIEAKFNGIEFTVHPADTYEKVSKRFDRLHQKGVDDQNSKEEAAKNEMWRRIRSYDTLVECLEDIKLEPISQSVLMLIEDALDKVKRI